MAGAVATETEIAGAFAASLFAAEPVMAGAIAAELEMAGVFAAVPEMDGAMIVEPVASKASAVVAAPGVAAAAPAVATSPGLAALSPAEALAPGKRAAAPVAVAAPNVAEAAPSSVVAASTGVTVAPAVAALAPEVVEAAAAEPVVATLPSLEASALVVAAPPAAVAPQPPPSSLVEAVPALAASSASSPVAAISNSAVEVEAKSAPPAAEAITTLPITIAPESITDTPLAMINTTSKPTIQTPCLEWGVNKTNQEDCTLPWVMIGEDCFLLSSNHNFSTLMDSRNYCKKIHAEADLAIPTNLTLIKEYLLNKGSPLVNRTLWIGGSDSCTPGELQWLDGSAINNSLWLEGEPLLKNKGNDCVVVDVDNTKLVTKNCTEQHKFICQKSAKKTMKTTTSNSTIPTQCYVWGVNKVTEEECKLPWTMIGGDCLLLSSNQNASTLIDSRNSCKKIHADADLAIPTDFDLIKEYLLKKGSPLVNRTLWVGGSDFCVPGEPKWLDGSSINSSLWLNGKPTLTDKGNECVVMDVHNKKLLTKNCTEQYKFICQKSVTVLNTTNLKPTQTACYNWGVNKTNQEECKLPWTMIGRDCLLLSSNQNVSTLKDSRQFCKKIHPEADLAIPADFQLIKEFLLKKESPLVNHNLWVGGSDFCEPGEPRWLNGSAINNNLWVKGKPTVINKGNECVLLDVINKNLLTKTCTEQYKFICEKSAKIK